jgi:hypothetical protein
VLRLFDATSNPELIPAIRADDALDVLPAWGTDAAVPGGVEGGQGADAGAVGGGYAMMAKGLPVNVGRVREGIADQVRIALMRLEKRGRVRWLVEAPEVWWELVGNP